MCAKIHHTSRSRRCPASRNSDPLFHTAPLLSLDIDKLSITLTTASHTILFHRVPRLPILIFFLSYFFILGGLFEIRCTRQLACRRICWTMLDGCMSITKIAEIVYVSRTQKRSSSKGMDGCIAPLLQLLAMTVPFSTRLSNLPAPSKSHHCDPSSGRNPHILCF